MRGFKSRGVGTRMVSHREALRFLAEGMAVDGLITDTVTEELASGRYRTFGRVICYPTGDVLWSEGLEHSPSRQDKELALCTQAGAAAIFAVRLLKLEGETRVVRLALVERTGEECRWPIAQESGQSGPVVSCWGVA